METIFLIPIIFMFLSLYWGAIDKTNDMFTVSKRTFWSLNLFLITGILSAIIVSF